MLSKIISSFTQHVIQHAITRNKSKTVDNIHISIVLIYYDFDEQRAETRMRETDFKICFWGCRGACALSGSGMTRYGTNTACVSMECGGMPLVFDVGTGFIRFGEYCQKTNPGGELHIFLSHFHLDHLEGLPHAGILYDPAVTIHFYAMGAMGSSPRELLANIFSPPYFPIPVLDKNRTIVFHELSEAGALHPAGSAVSVEYLSVHHPGGSISYKVGFGGKTAVYLSDYEYAGRMDPALEEYLRGADLVIFDANFGDADYIADWGHSTWQEGLAVCRALDIGRMVLFHHRVGRTDDELDEAERGLRAMSERCHMAREGEIVYL